MGLILPIFHEVFEPPPTHISIFDSSEIKDKTMKETIEALPKSVEHSVNGYEIVEIPRHPEDKEDGFLIAGISPGSFAASSLWHKVDSVIDAWIKCCRDF